MKEVVILLVAQFLLISSFIIRAPKATCPVGSYVEGVRPDGSSQCHFEDHTFLPIKLYCPSPTQPRVNIDDGRTIYCARVR